MTTVYCDAESGTWFLCPPVRIDADNWSDADWDAWDNIMSDADRGAYSEQYTEHQMMGILEIMPSPEKYCNQVVAD